MTQLKILSWNIWGGKNLQEIIQLLREADADVVGLQEVLQDEDGKNNNALQIAEALGYEWVYALTKTLTPDISHLLKEHHVTTLKGWGNAILSKHHIEFTRTHKLSEERSRTAIEAVATIEGSEIHLFSTHLAHGEDQSDKQREQTESLLQVVPKNRAVVMGDFNATPESEVMQMIQKELSCGDDEITGTTLRDTHAHIDYICTTKDIHRVSGGVLSSGASDHFPIVAEVHM